MKGSFALFLLAMMCFAPMTGCQSANAANNTGFSKTQRIPRQYFVLLDLSMSRSNEMQDEAVDYLRRLAGNLKFGDEITVMRVQEIGLAGMKKPWSDAMPQAVDPSNVSSRDSKRLAAEQDNVKDAVQILAKPPKGEKILHTDIIATLELAGELANDRPALSTTLIVLSDMLQSTKDIEMEHIRRMPGPDWIGNQQKLGSLPRFPGACVLVVGADGTSSDGAKVRSFWQSYFVATGAQLPPGNYRAIPPATGEANCS